MNLKIFVMIGLVLSSGAIALVYPSLTAVPTENYTIEPKNKAVLFVPQGENWTALEVNLAGPLFYRYFASDGYALVYEQKLTEHLHLYTVDNGLYKTYTVEHNGFPYQPLWVEEVVAGKNLETFILLLQYDSGKRYFYYFGREQGQLWERLGQTVTLETLEEGVTSSYPFDMALSPGGEFLLVAHSTVVWIHDRTMDNRLFHDFGLTTEAVDTNGEFVAVTVE